MRQIFSDKLIVLYWIHCYDNSKQFQLKTRMHSSRMRTAHSLTVSLCVVVSHTCPPSNHACSPRATMHAPPEQPHMPPRATMHAPPEQPRMPPREQPCMPPGSNHARPLGSNHAHPPSNHASPPEQQRTPPGNNHARPSPL